MIETRSVRILLKLVDVRRTEVVEDIAKRWGMYRQIWKCKQVRFRNIVVKLGILYASTVPHYKRTTKSTRTP